MSHPLPLPYARTKLAGVCRRIHRLELLGGVCSIARGATRGRDRTGCWAKRGHEETAKGPA